MARHFRVLFEQFTRWVLLLCALCYLHHAAAADKRTDPGLDEIGISGFDKSVASFPVVSPDDSVVAPTAFGANTGDIFAGLSLNSGNPASHHYSSTLVLGLGWGDARTVSLTTSLSLAALPTVFQTGDLNFQLSHNFSPEASVAVGVQNAFPYGANAPFGQSYYVVGSRQFKLRPQAPHTLPLSVSLGVGNNSFGNAISTQYTSAVAPFLSLGLDITPNFTLIAEEVGCVYNLGASISPGHAFPFVINLVSTNVLHYQGSYGSFAVTLAWGTHLS
ncbi:MAG: hypothetical protein HY939_06285 [Gammaproteobacteria bacterium]|nr:hypothetical protein [Gammaproteobacteria bacterium]